MRLLVWRLGRDGEGCQWVREAVAVSHVLPDGAFKRYSSATREQLEPASLLMGAPRSVTACA